MGLFPRPRKLCLHFPVLLLPHCCADVVDSELKALSLPAAKTISLRPAARLQKGQRDNAQPRNVGIFVIIEPVQRLLSYAVVLPIIVNLQTKAHSVIGSKRVHKPWRGTLSCGRCCRGLSFMPKILRSDAVKSGATTTSD